MRCGGSSTRALPTASTYCVPSGQMVSLNAGCTASAGPHAAAASARTNATEITTRIVRSTRRQGRSVPSGETARMLIRSLLRVAAAVAFAALIAPAVPSAAPPPGLAYDEIVRVVVNATPPPPGNFQADLAALTAPAVAASPTPAPKKRGIGIGAIAGALAGGGAGAVAGAVAGDA